MNLRARLAATVFATTLGVLAFAPAAGASFHLDMVREVFLGAAGNDSFIELQMPAAGENQVVGQKVRFFGPTGSLQGESPPFPGNADKGQSQRTILIGDTAVDGRDFTYDQFYETNSFLGAGGAACYTGSGDCVAWGNFADASDLNDYTGNAGTPVLPGGIPIGSSITRKLTRGCRTALDGPDDSNNSAADFALTNTPSPRGNSRAPTERLCVPCGGRRSTITGTNGKDKLRGTAGRDVIAGRGGGDTIRGLGGNDIICGGGGPDKLIGGAGKDKLIGGPGRDALIGGPGNDKQVQ